MAPSAAKRVSAALMVSTRSGAASVPCGQFRLQRLDMGVDLDVLAEILADVALQPVRDVVGGGQLHVAVDLEVDADDQLARRDRAR